MLPVGEILLDAVERGLEIAHVAEAPGGTGSVPSRKHRAPARSGLHLQADEADERDVAVREALRAMHPTACRQSRPQFADRRNDRTL